MQKMNIESLLLLNLVTNLLTSFYCFAIKKSRFKTIYNFTKLIIIEVSEFGKFNLGGYFANIVFKNADTFIISLFLGPTYLAIYSLPSKLMAIIELPLGSFVGTGMSAMAVAMNRDRKDELLQIFKKFVGLLTITFIPLVIGCMIFADLAISILGGAKYVGSEAANIFRIMVFFTVLFPFDRFSGITLDMLQLPHLNFQKILIMTFFSIGGVFVGVLVFKNLYGIAIVSQLTVISGVLFGYYSLRKYLDFTIPEIIQIGLKEFKLRVNQVFEICKSFI
jgi:O-antigen/teichoic acid export membrane protein